MAKGKTAMLYDFTCKGLRPNTRGVVREVTTTFKMVDQEYIERLLDQGWREISRVQLPPDCQEACQNFCDKFGAD